MRLILLSALVATLTGCAAPVYNYTPQSLAISEPSLGTIVTSQVGDDMLKQGRYSEHDALVLASTTSVSLYTLAPGVYLKRGQDGPKQFFMPGGGSDGGGVTKNIFADPWQSVMVMDAERKVCIVTVLNAYTCGNVPYTLEKRPVFTQNSFQQTLIYSGKAGNKINVGYREFSNNAARPAFSNNVEYDLSESTTIGYKGAQIEVLEATNQFVRYKVVRNFNAASQ